MLGGTVVLLLVALPIGIASAVWPDGWMDRALAIGAVGLFSIPPYLLSVVLLNKVAPHLGIVHHGQTADVSNGALPPGYCPLRGHGATVTPGAPAGNCSGASAWFLHLLLPWLAFAAGMVALYGRIVRAGLAEVLHEQHVMVARAKGASELRIVCLHALRIAAGPVISLLAAELSFGVSLVLFIEVVFGLPGIGMAIWTATVANQPAIDLPIVLGVTVLTAVLSVTANLVADLVAVVLDPRARAEPGRPLS